VAGSASSSNASGQKPDKDSSNGDNNDETPLFRNDMAPKKILGRIHLGGHKEGKRGRGKSTERRAKRGDNQETEKKGFFRKMFRGKHQKNKVLEQADQLSAENMKQFVPSPPPPPPPPSPTTKESASVESIKTVKPDENKKAKVPLLDSEVIGTPRVASPGSEKAGAIGGGLVGMDTVKSDTEADDGEIFFANDDISTLTAPSAHSRTRCSIEPSDSVTAPSSEPIGHYWNGPTTSKSHNSESTPKAENVETARAPSPSPSSELFDKPSFQDPDGELPITSKRVNDTKCVTNLKVDVKSVQADPVGESPCTRPGTGMRANEPSPRGWESPVTKFQDPLGSNVSESSSKSGGFGREPTSKSKLPPSGGPKKRTLPHELRREPSAFRDGSPYSLDPPLRCHTGDEDDDEVDTKSLADILSRTSSRTLSARSRKEPPSPSRKVNSVSNQQPTPSKRSEELKKIHSGYKPSPVFREERSLPTLAQSIAARAQTPDGTDVANTKPKITSLRDASPSVKLDSPDSTGFLDELFDEKPIQKRSSDQFLPTGGNGDDTEKSSAKSREKQICRVQRLAKSPGFNEITLWNRDMMQDNKNATLLSVLPPKCDQLLSRRAEEEKKEEESDLAESEAKLLMFANSTAALGSAACMNAKTIAYLHTLNGEPSPRQSWRRPDFSDDEYSPVKITSQKKAVSNMKAAMANRRVLDADAVTDAHVDVFDACLSNPMANKGTRPTIKKRGDKPTAFISSKVKLSSKYGALSPRSRKAARANFKRPVHWFRFNRDVRVTGAPLAYGLDLQRSKREEDILSGRVAPVKKSKTGHSEKSSASSPYKTLRDEDIKDPIQRAGVRLLSKAAVPIQTVARQYLACREASDRMHATLVLQSYFRRWKAEAFLRGYRHACTKIQAAHRSWAVRDEVSYNNYSATQIQKIVRGYIAAAYVYDVIYWITRVQACARGKLGRMHFVQLKKQRQACALKVQSLYRGCIVRRKCTQMKHCICTIQASYRAHVAQNIYQEALSSLIKMQGVVRQLAARKEMQARRFACENLAASKIQATWRGFQGYTDYIFALVDILVIQRSMRKWIAQKKVTSVRENQAATKIQTQWRRQRAIIGMLYDLVHIIIVQSVIRRFLAQKKLPQKRLEYSNKMIAQQKLDGAATKIQTAWRGFWGYSHYVILQYEIIRLQAIVRGRASRNLYSLKLGCCIMIQSAARRHLASQRTTQIRMEQAALGADVESMRTKLASSRIQFWWRVVMECNREKQAALVIEGFFLMVKAEVDKEINRQRHLIKQSRRSRPSDRRVSEVQLLENVWQHAGANPVRNSRSLSVPRLHQNPSYISETSNEESPSNAQVRHRSSSPSMRLVMRHDNDEQALIRERKDMVLMKASRRIKNGSPAQPPPDVTLAKSDERTELSEITSPTVFKKRGKHSKKKKTSKNNSVDDDMSVESLLGETIVDRRQSAPTSKEQNYFFSDDIDTRSKYPNKGKFDSTFGIVSGSETGSPKMYSRNATETTATIETMSHSDGSNENENCNQRQLLDEYSISAAAKGRKLLESVRNDSWSKRSLSPRHGRIVVQNASAEYPMATSEASVEVEYVGNEFGLI